MARSPFHVRREQHHLAWDGAIAPVLRVASGDEVDVRRARRLQRPAHRRVRRPADIATLDFANVDQVCGPVFVEGAEPGDTLQVELLDFTPGDWGWTAAIPGFGLLADDFPEPALRISRIAGRARGAAARPAHPDRAVLRLPGRGARGRGALHDPADRAGRQHGHPPPDRRRRRCGCRSPCPARCSAWVTGTRPRATARSAARPWRRRCSRACA